MSRGAVSADQCPEHRTGGTLIDIQAALERVLALSRADACIVIGRRQTSANLRWANNTLTTNGALDQASLFIVSVIGRRVASVSRTYFPLEQIEAIVRECEAACAGRPEAPDFMPLLADNGEPADWGAPAMETGIHVFDAFAPALGRMFDRGRSSDIQTFGYAEHGASTVWLAMSTGLRRRCSDRIGRVEITAKPPDFSRSSWYGTATQDFSDIEPMAILDGLEQRLSWFDRRIDLPAGLYDVLLEPSCTADLALGAYAFMARRDADEGQSPYAGAAGGTRIGERLFGSMTMYSDPHEQGTTTSPVHVVDSSDGLVSVFDNGLSLARTEWVGDGQLRALFTPRYWAARAGTSAPTPYIDNLIVSGGGPSMDEMIAETRRALLVTSLWYIRTVDPRTALLTGLTRDGVFLVENGQVKGAVNNFRWNMSPIAAFAQATQFGATRLSLPRQHDERVKAPPVRVERFHMSSVSEAT